jgi:F-type H+-transporting ATPase subunit c
LSIEVAGFGPGNRAGRSKGKAQLKQQVEPREKKGAKGMERKKALLRIAVLVTLISVALPAIVMAEEAAAGGEGKADSLKALGLAIGGGLGGVGLGLAALGGGIGQGKTAAAALEGIARNPGASDKIFVPMIIGLALIESLVLYTFIIAIFLQGKI